MEIFILCLTIFFVRIIDVSMGTVRVIVTVKGKSVLASLIGFFEVLIWFLIAREALNVETPTLFINIVVAVSYAGGYAAGTFLGSVLSNRFVSGNYGVQVIMDCMDRTKIDRIRKEGYAVSVIDVEDKEGDTVDRCMLMIMIKKKRLDHLKKLIKSIDNNAFIVINETKMVHNGFFK